MARIILGSYMIRYPLGGMMSWVLQYLVGFQRLGHDVYFVEKSGYANACYDPSQGIMTDDCSYGVKVVGALLGRFGLEDRWCHVDVNECYHGLSKEHVDDLFKSADLFVDMGTHGAWLQEAQHTGCTVLVDGEPGFTQMKMHKRLAAGETLPDYDFYYTTGQNIGRRLGTAPTAGKSWGHLFHPVVLELFPQQEAPEQAPFTTVMNWQSYESLEFEGTTFGHKDVEFEKFIDLPGRVASTMEIAVSGRRVPTERLLRAGWSLRNAHDVTSSYDSFAAYVRQSRGEFSVCKNGFVATNSAWFGDRSAAYLASGRPVVLQETGFSQHLSCGKGLFAVRNAEEAAAAISELDADYQYHCRWARRIAAEYLDAPRVLGKFLDELGVSSTVKSVGES
jgi:hypothetical protein